MHKRLYVVLVAAASACADPPEDAKHGNVTTVVSAITTPIARPAEEPMLEIAQQVAGFAGYYCENGDLVVGMAGPPQPAQDALAIQLVTAADVARACHTRALPMHVPQVTIARKKHSFFQLRAWRDSIVQSFFGTDGAIGIGINYTNNKLRLKVEVGNRGPTEALSASYQLPLDAFMITESTRARPQYACPNPYYGSYLYEACFRPIPGGVEMSPTQGGDCTITAATDRYLPQYGYWQSGLVTAGHCQAPTGSLTGKYLYQHDNNEAAQYVGSEFVDPPFWACWAFYRCRYSDSTWVFAGNAPVQHGTIAQTWYSQSGNSGSLAVSSTHPRFYVWGKTAAVENMQVEKVGRSTGWTTGTVTDTCSDETTDEYFSDGRIHIYICQYLTTLYNSGGDSGSPVFYWWWFYGVDTVELVGLLWGQGYSANEGLVSPWTNVENDLGPNLYIQYPYF